MTVVTNTSKSKGNAFENLTAKTLSMWIFKDKTVLTRSLTSGAIKSTYVGDIVPSNFEVFSKFLKSWKFIIECKHGYSTSIPTLIKQTIVREWLTKLQKERTLSKSQNIIMLICKFNRQSTILITNYNFNDIKPQLMMYNNDELFNIYLFDELTKYNFNELYKEEE